MKNYLYSSAEPWNPCQHGFQLCTVFLPRRLFRGEKEEGKVFLWLCCWDSFSFSTAWRTNDDSVLKEAACLVWKPIRMRNRSWRKHRTTFARGLEQNRSFGERYLQSLSGSLSLNPCSVQGCISLQKVYFLALRLCSLYLCAHTSHDKVTFPGNLSGQMCLRSTRDSFPS